MMEIMVKITKEEFEKLENQKGVIYFENGLYQQIAVDTFDDDYNSVYYLVKSQKIVELEAQIEKMKCCGNCRNVTATPIKGTLVYSCGETRNDINFFKACDKWEIKENDRSDIK